MEAALAQGASVNGTSRSNVTPLIAAAMSGRVDAVKFLVARGADVTAEDSFYRFSAGEAALANSHADISLFLLDNGWPGAGDLLTFAIQSDNVALAKTILSRKVSRENIEAAIDAAERLKNPRSSLF